MKNMTVARRLKLLAGIVLALSLMLPLYSWPRATGERAFAYAWQLALDDWVIGAWLALAYLWPAVLLILSRFSESGRWRFLILLLEPVFAVISGVFIFNVCAAAFSWEPILEQIPFFFVPVPSAPGIGCWSSLAADGLYLLTSLVGLSLLVLRRISAASHKPLAT